MKKSLIYFCLTTNFFNTFAMQKIKICENTAQEAPDLIPLHIKQNIALHMMRHEKNIVQLVKDIINLSSCNSKWRIAIEDETFWQNLFFDFFIKLNFDKECQIIDEMECIPNCLITNCFKKIINHLVGEELENQLQKSKKLLLQIKKKIRFDASGPRPQERIAISNILFLISKELKNILSNSEFWKFKFANFFAENIKSLKPIELDLQIHKCEEFFRRMQSKEVFKNNKVIMNAFLSVLNEMKVYHKFKKSIFFFDLIRAKEIVDKIKKDSKKTAGRTPELLNLEELKKIISQAEDLIEDMQNCNLTKFEFYSIVLLNAISSGYNEIVQLLLVNPNVNINFQNYYGWTALMLASSSGDAKTVKELIEMGADLNMKNNLGWTPLIIASRRGFKHIVKILLDTQNIDALMVNLKDNAGSTALIHAMEKQHYEIAQMLISAGADKNIELKEYVA